MKGKEDAESDEERVREMDEFDEQRELERRLDDLYRDFFRMDSLYSAFAKRHGESYHALAALDILGEHPDGIRQKDLVKLMFLPKQTVGAIMGGFERRGLADHRRAAADGRSKLHFLTPAGEAYHRRVIGALRDIELECARLVGAEDMGRAHDINTRLFDAFEEALKKEDRKDEETR